MNILYIASWNFDPAKVKKAMESPRTLVLPSDLAGRTAARIIDLNDPTLVALVDDSGEPQGVLFPHEILAGASDSGRDTGNFSELVRQLEKDPADHNVPAVLFAAKDAEG